MLIVFCDPPHLNVCWFILWFTQPTALDHEFCCCIRNKMLKLCFLDSEIKRYQSPFVSIVYQKLTVLFTEWTFTVLKTYWPYGNFLMEVDKFLTIIDRNGFSIYLGLMCPVKNGCCFSNLSQIFKRTLEPKPDAFHIQPGTSWQAFFCFYDVSPQDVERSHLFKGHPVKPSVRYIKHP